MPRGYCAWPEVTILHLNGGLGSYRLIQRYCGVYSLKRTQDPRVHSCVLAALLLSLHPISSLIVAIFAKSCPTWTTTCQAFLSFTISRSLLKLMSVMLSNHLILRHPLLLLSSNFPSIRTFSNESAFTIKEPKYWHFSINTSNEYARLISFRIDRFDFLAVPGTVKNLLQHHNLKASMLQHSAFHD